MEFLMHRMAKLLCASGLAIATNFSVCALDVHHVHGLKLRKGEALRVTPEGQLQIVQLQGVRLRMRRGNVPLKSRPVVLPYGLGMTASRGF